MPLSDISYAKVSNTTKFQHRILVLCLILSFYFQSYYLDVGFSLKSFFVLCPIAWMLLAHAKLYKHITVSEAIYATFLSAYFLTGVYSYDPLASLRFILGSCLLIIIYLMTKSILSKIPKEQLIDSLVKAGLFFNFVSSILYLAGLYTGGIVAVFEDLTIVYGVMYDRGIPRLIGPLKDPNFFILFGSIFFFLSLGFFRKLQCKVLFIWTLLNFILTFSRGGFLALICGLLVFLLLSSGSRFKRAFQVIFICSISLVLVWYLMPEAQDFLIKRIDSIENASGRFDIWKNGIETFFEHPFAGIGVFSFLSYNIEKFGGEHYMHNTFLEVLVEGGVFVFLAYIIFWISLLMSGYKNISKNNNIAEREFNVAVLCSLVVALVSFISISAVINEFFLLIFAIISAYSNGRVAKNNI